MPLICLGRSMVMETGASESIHEYREHGKSNSPTFQAIRMLRRKISDASISLNAVISI